ncbi:hypothetical protein [Arthrobacter sp. HY1533]|uniref:hypothetical protein n=1 Tax=Arthrobacter sp. HY1533 TaxID=2970919 RepID=UPI0022B9E71B|nr:hypothetical protein [Arthrobacter sp. HY1533]
MFYHQANIAKVIGGKPPVGQSIEMNVDAQLVPEPDNPHGTHAISVRVNGRIIAYISKDDDASYWNDIGRIAASGHTAVTTARIWASTQRPWDGRGANKFESRVTLVLREPNLLTPINNAPTGTYSVLPWGGGLQVIKEENHFDVLFNYVPPSGVGMLLLTMHRGINRLKNGTEKQFIEVRLEGERVGELSGATSGHYLPVVEHMETMNVLPVAWATIKGSALAAQLTLQAAKSTEIPDEWIIGPATTVPKFVPHSDSYTIPPTYQGELPTPAAAGRPPTATISTPSSFRAAPQASAPAAGQPKVKRGTVPTDEHRKSSPTMHRLAGVSMIILGVLLGGILALIPGIGPLLCIGVIWLGIYGNIVRRRIAKTLEAEASSGQGTQPSSR